MRSAAAWVVAAVVAAVTLTNAQADCGSYDVATCELGDDVCDFMAVNVGLCMRERTAKNVRECIVFIYRWVSKRDPGLVVVTRGDESLSAWMRADGPKSLQAVLQAGKGSGKNCHDFHILIEQDSDDIEGGDSPLPTADAFSDSDFIRVIYEGSSAAAESAIKRAASHWNNVLRGSLVVPWSVVEPENLLAFCGVDHTLSPGEYGGLYIYAKVDEIDGAGAILGYAGPCYGFTLKKNIIPSIGIMVFDEADIDLLDDEGTLESVMLHEMGHVLGIGSLWNRHLRKRNSDAPEFNGANARKTYKAMGGKGRPPVEGLHGEGTRLGHWAEHELRNELMTGFLDTRSPMSTLTLSALQDLGYVVNVDMAEEFALPEQDQELRGRKMGSSSSYSSYGDDILHVSKLGVMDYNGNVVDVLDLDQ